MAPGQWHDALESAGAVAERVSCAAVGSKKIMSAEQLLDSAVPGHQLSGTCATYPT